ncbi:MAG: hypothetical protein M2R45_04443 [Verrucomicrobia subdivision 3 bacterium]|nr:hypothetical protein [Limisphaerales bacterium]MCS1415025.1 hypothetical protein [Limisphaerales bacterium]
MNSFTSNNCLVDRREFLGGLSHGLAGIALTTLLAKPALQASKRQGHHKARAKRVLQVFCPGAVSHVDTWDHKPALERHHGTPLPGEEAFLSFQGKNGNLMKSPWAFRPAGQSGKMITEMLPHLASHVDNMAFIHSMTSKTNTHGPGCIFMNTGFTAEGFPANGAWISYALGSTNANLPAYVSIPDSRGEPPSGKANWSSGFLPAEHQGVSLNAQRSIRNLNRPATISHQAEQAYREFLTKMNRRHEATTPGLSDLNARIAAYELAGRMQLSAPEATDFGSESAATRKLYGTEDPNPLKAAYAKNCLLARRLLERGVRFVTLYCGSRASGVDGLLNWDAHKKLKADYERHCPILDQPSAALITDLKTRGLLGDTLIIWTSEFGRMPTHQEGTAGRDHNPDAFTLWMLGAGVKSGVSYGATDDFGRRSVENITSIYDFYATVLNILGIDHTKLTFYHNGIERRLTDVHGRLISEILA